MKHPSVVIVGAGFAGTACYQLLKRQTNWKLTIIDEDDSFEYTPAIHETLTHPRRSAQLSLDYHKLFGSDFVKASVESIENGKVSLGEKTLPATYIVLATGASAKIPRELSKACLPLKTLADAALISSRLSKDKPVNVIGGGYTGVEVAGVLADAGFKVCLIHSRERLLDSMTEGVSHYCHNRLSTKGVSIILGDRLKAATSTSLTLTSGKSLESGVNILTIGSAPNHSMLPFEDSDLFPSCSLASYPHVFVAGDLALGKALPTAHNAMVLGRFVAEQMIRHYQRFPLKPFKEASRPLAIALGNQAGLLTFGSHGVYLPYGIGFAKRIIEWRVIAEFAFNIPLPL